MAGLTAGVYKDMRDGSKYDLMIAGISAASLILIIMLIITRSLVAAITIVGTVLISLGASFGLSVLLWQDILGKQLHWICFRCRSFCCWRWARTTTCCWFPGSKRKSMPASRPDHPVDGRHRRGRDVRGSGVRRHDGDVCD